MNVVLCRGQTNREDAVKGDVVLSYLRSNNSPCAGVSKLTSRSRKFRKFRNLLDQLLVPNLVRADVASPVFVTCFAQYKGLSQSQACCSSVSHNGTIRSILYSNSLQRASGMFNLNSTTLNRYLFIAF